MIDDFAESLNKGIMKHNKEIAYICEKLLIFPIDPDSCEFYMIGKNIHEDWLEFLNDPQLEINVKLFVTYILAHYHGAKVFPLRRDVFRAFHIGPRDIKVVIFGQDPYPGIIPEKDGDPVAMGLSFATRDKKCPASLRRIFKALEKQYGVGMKSQTDFTLSGWTRQGVMLLNYNLFFYYGKPDELKDARSLSIWRGFSENIIRKIKDENPNSIFLLMGKFAQSLKKDINSNYVESPHPSPMGGHEFTGECFLTVNSLLKKKGIDEINWIENI